MRTYKELISDAQKLAEDTSISNQEFRKRASILLAEAERYGVYTEIHNMLTVHRKQASAPTQPKFNYTELPLRNPKEVEKAAEWFAAHRGRFPIHIRRKQATEILKRASELGVELNDDLEQCLMKSANLGLVNKNFIVHELQKRADYFENTGKKPISDSIKSIIGELQKCENDDELLKSCFATKLAEYIDALDRRYNILTKYGRHFQIPEDFIFAESIEPIYEVASLIGNVKTGKYYAPEDLEKLDLKQFIEVLGPGFEKAASVAGITVDAVGLKEWFKSASLNDAQLFDTIAASQGIYPKAEKLPEA